MGYSLIPVRYWFKKLLEDKNEYQSSPIMSVEVSNPIQNDNRGQITIIHQQHFWTPRPQCLLRKQGNV
jgi:hypothetical protein